ncbi:hypothetical protein [Streptomyces sp. NPDC001774]
MTSRVSVVFSGPWSPSGRAPSAQLVVVDLVSPYWSDSAAVTVRAVGPVSLSPVRVFEPVTVFPSPDRVFSLMLTVPSAPVVVVFTGSPNRSS